MITKKSIFYFMKMKMVQYLFTGKEHKVDADVQHGNSRQKNRGYKRVMVSTRKSLETKHPTSKKSATEILDEVYRDVGDVTNAQSTGQLPRGPTDVYNARHAAKKKNSATNEDQNEMNTIRGLLEKAKGEENVGEDSVFIREAESIQISLSSWLAIVNFKTSNISVLRPVSDVEFNSDELNLY
jgi:hypothetical protein